MYYDDRFPPYVPVAERRRRAAAEMKQLAKRGHKVSPVVITGRAIATTVWGKAWCDHLETYSDYASRVPRGRTYARNGSVVDLQLAPGRVDARVSGSELYQITIKVAALPKARWQTLCEECAGGIDSLVEMLQGRIAASVLERLCRPKDGLFPTTRELTFECSCPDAASMCKHIAAVLYGVGARLDHTPELLFTLRKVDAQDLLAQTGAGLAAPARAGARTLASDDLGALFGLELDLGDAPVAPPVGVGQGKAKAKAKAITQAKPAKPTKPAPAKPTKPAPAKATKPAPAKASKPAPAKAPTLSTRALTLLRQEGPLSLPAAAATLAVDVSVLRPVLAQLVADGRASVIGKTRGTRYQAAR
jgi:uncharacterized Zn finger protein